MLVLGIETSCDETAAALVRSDKHIVSHILRTQATEHQNYGGVVPEIAARSHSDFLPGIVDECFREAGVAVHDVDAIAVTGGPGLIGGVIVGVMFAKGLALASGKPLVAVNHLEGHALSPRLAFDIPFPFLLLLVSGGHCQFLVAEDVGRYRKLGGTLDDALGEAFDKTAKMLGLGYPGGPAVEQAAKLGDPKRFAFPRAMVGREGCDLSFSGVKTAVRLAVQALGNPTPQDVNDICASFQACVGDILVDRTKRAIAMARATPPPACGARPGGGTASSPPNQAYRFPHPDPWRGAPLPHAGEGVHALVIAGGVAANQTLRGVLQRVAEEASLPFYCPPLALCTDNAAMIAWAGLERFQRGLTDTLDFEPKARWPL